MKLKFPKAIVLFGLIAACPALAQESQPAADSSAPPDQRKVSYALGMNLGLQIKSIGADVDVNVIARALKDVLNEKPTRLQAAQIRPIFTQEEAFERAKISAKDKSAGESFLARNAKGKRIMVLPDGLQYRVLHEGTGDTPKSTDSVIVNYRGTLIDGTEFSRRDQFETPVNGRLKGWQEALQLMKTGSHWQIFLPSDLAYGRDWIRGVGPDSTVVFDLELVSVNHSPAPFGGGIVHPIPQDSAAGK